ncbi:MAG: aldolase [Phycisphaeraceae bacterium]|nr:aldolase [Phycisphaeraceae bacterium]
MKLRPSRVLAKLRSGGIASCIKLNFADARVADLAAMHGFDCVWLDMEHSPSALHDVEKQVYAIRSHDVDALVRVQRGSYSDLIHPLEMDATGIMIPHVMNAGDARALVRHTRFHPQGLRPMDGGNADGAYGTVTADEYMRHANEQRFIILQIEDPEAMDNIDEIAAVEGYDMLFYGAGDYSQAIGVPGRMDHPKILEGARKIAEACARHGKIAGLIAIGDQVPEKIAMGYRFLSLGADVLGLNAYFGAALENFRKAAGSG